MRIAGKILLVSVLLTLVLFSGCGVKKEEIPMGRYNEREVQVKGSGFTYMHPLPDGGYYLYGADVALTRVEADGTSNKKNWLWENNSNIHLKASFGVADDGAVIFGYTPLFYSSEEYEEYAKDGDDRYMYCYVDAGGGRHMLDLYGDDWTIAENLEYFAFAKDHRIYGASASRVYRMDVESGEVVSLFDTEGAVNEFAFVGDVMIALDSNRAYLYDMAGEKLLDDNEVLSEFVASHQTGRKAVVLAVAQEDILYLACRTGLYRYIWNGSVIEQIADGQLLSLGDTQYYPVALQALPDEEFRLYLSGNHMVELFYDETVPSRPSRELTIYSLEENGRIRYAGQLFQKTHPDVLVKYETGMDGDTAASKEDALKNLSTRLLAGEGPDILILDDMDIGQYARKGILKSLDGFIAPYEEEGSLYQGILDGMRVRCEGYGEELYAVPLSVFLPMYQTDRKYLEGEDSLDDLVAGMEQAREEHPEGPLLFAPTKELLLRQLTIVCEPAWRKEDGSLDRDKIEEYYEAAYHLWELDSMGMTSAERAKWQEDTNYYMGGRDNVLDITEALVVEDGSYSNYYHIGETWAVLGCLESPYESPRQMRVKKDLHDNNWYYGDAKDAEEIYFDKYIGQAADVYWARSIVGICEDGKEKELSEDFLALCLSSEIQNKWWIGPGKIYESGIPIRKESFAACMDHNNHEYAAVAGWDASSVDRMYKEYFFPTEEQKQTFYQMMEEASVAYLPGLALEETVEEVGLSVLDGDMTPQEGAGEVERRMAIAMEE